MSRSTIVLIVFLVIMGLGALIVAREFRTKLMTPAGLRISSAQRLRSLHTAMLAYREVHQAWPDSRLSLLRDRHLSVSAAAGIAYEAPAETAEPSTIILWREMLMPGALTGEPWSGPDQLADHDIPPIGHAMTLSGELLELDERGFNARFHPDRNETHIITPRP